MSRICHSCGRLAPDEALSCPSCKELLRPAVGVDDVVELAEEVGQALGPHYTVRDKIGRGGYAVVFRVRDEQLERDLAVKALIPEFAATREVAERFRREAVTGARLHHPNIVPIYFVGEAEHTPCFAMPLIGGETLAARLRREGQLSPRAALGILQDVASALDYAHQAGVVHRDVKPDNIMLELESGRAVLADFGIAKALAQDSWRTASGILVGTPYYMSPEQAAGEREIGPASDVYSLAVVLFEMLAGEPPYGGLNAQVVLSQHVSGAVPDLGAQRSDVPSTAVRVVQQALAKDPADRFASPGAFASAFQEALGSVGLRRSSAGILSSEGQRTDDMRLFRTLGAVSGDDPVAVVRDADDVGRLTEGVDTVLRRLEATPEEAKPETLIDIVRVLRQRAGDTRPALRQVAREGLARVAQNEALVAVLATAWRRGSGDMQVAVEGVVGFLLPRATDVLLALGRREKSPEIFLLADRTGALGDDHGDSLARDRSPAVIQAFASALRDSGRPSPVLERWLALMARHERADVRVLAAEVASARGGALAERIGRRLAADADARVRAAAFAAMGASKRREVLPDLARALVSGDEADQVAAAEALGSLAFEEVVPMLAEVLERRGLLRRRRGPVQHAAARALASLPRGMGSEVLQRFRDDSDTDLRRIARGETPPSGAE